MEVGGSQFPAPKSGYGTPESWSSSFQLTLTGLSPSMAGRFRPLQLRWRGGDQVHYTTSTMSRPHGVRFGLFPFRSPLLRESRLVSLPPPTKMFPFGGFPLLCYEEHRESLSTFAVGGPIRESPDRRLHAPTRGLSRLVAPFFGVQAEPSTRRRSMSGLLGSGVQLASRPMHGFIVRSMVYGDLTLPFALQPVG